MDGIFLEFENENALRSYPFATGCVETDENDRIPAGVFVDAALYPVNPSGTLYLSSISEDGVFSISDANGIAMTGVASGSTVELYDHSSFKRHVGTLVASSADALSEFAGRGVLREYSSDETAFASDCVFPVVIDGVVSVTVGETLPVAGSLSFTNGDSDDVRVSKGELADGRHTLRFDVIPKIEIPDDRSIRRIICVVDGQTPFRIMRGLTYNSIVVTLDGIDRDAVCAAAHREDQFVMVDTCSCEEGACDDEPTNKEQLPDTYQLEEVFIPPDEDESEGGMPNGARNAFYLVVPNLSAYINPLSITLQDGVIVPKVNDPEVVMDGNTATLADGEMLDEVASKGVVLQVPGLSGGDV